MARAVALESPDLSYPLTDTLVLQLTSPLSSSDTQQILSYLHQFFHPNNQALTCFVSSLLQFTPEDWHFLSVITASWKICQMSDPNSRCYRPPFPIHQARGSLPGTDRQLDFTHIPTIKWVGYILMLADTSQGGWRHFPLPTKGLKQSLTSRSRRSSPTLESLLPSSQTMVFSSPPRFSKSCLKFPAFFPVPKSDTIPSPQER